jgi:hypothetical protein
MSHYYKYKFPCFITILLIILFSNSCNYFRYISGDKRWVKQDLGISITADSVLIPQNKLYVNEWMLTNKTGVYYSFRDDSISTNYIVWNNGWHTISINEENNNQIVYYTFDRKNRLRILNRFCTSCNCYVTKIKYNKKGKIVYLQNKGVSF